MASNIRGITVEISGNTTKLDQALKGVNKTSRDLQSELRQVNKALKFDPGNTTLLQQKQKLLAEAISNTKSKLDTLKEAERQAEQQFQSGKLGEDKFRALQREVVKTEQELKGLEKQASTTEMKLNKISATAEKVGSASSKIADKTRGASQAIVGVGAACTTMSVQAEDSMAKLWSLADHNVMSFNEMKQSAIDFSNETGLGFNDVCEQAYQLISAGTDTADVFNVMKGNADLSKTGFADLGGAVDLTTTILNAYKMSAEDLTRVSDVLNATQDKGKLTIAQLSSTMGDVIPIAYANNVSFEQLSASYATLTKNGISCEKSTTAIKGTISELGKSGSKSATILKNETGKSFQELMQSGKTLDEVLKIIQTGADKAGVKLSDCFANEEARLGAQSLSQNSNDFKDSLDAINNSSGLTEKKLGDLQTSGKGFKKSLNEIKNACIQLGDVLAPVFEVIANIVKGIASALSGLSPQMRTAIVTVALLIASISPVAKIVSSICTAVSLGVTVFKTFSTALSVVKGTATAATTGIKLLAGAITFLTSPIGLVIIAITALVAGFVYLWNTSEGFRSFWIGLWESIKEVTSNIVSSICSFFTETIPNAFSAAGNFFSNGWNYIKTLFFDGVNAIDNFFSVQIPVIVLKILTWIADIPNKIFYMFGYLNGIFVKGCSDIYNYFATNIPIWIDSIITWIQGIPDYIENSLIYMNNCITQWVLDTYNSFVNWCINTYNSVVQYFTDIYNSIVTIISNLPGAIWGWLQNAYNRVVEWGYNLVNAGYNSASQLVSSIVNTISSIPGHMLSIGRNVVEGLWNGIVGAKNWLLSKVSGFVDSIVEGFKDGLGIHSPSRRFKSEIGVYIPQGIGVGIDEEMPSLKDKINSIINNLCTGLSDTVDLSLGATFTPALAGIDPSQVYSSSTNINTPIEVTVVNNIDSKPLEKSLTTRVEKNISRKQENYRNIKGR